MTESIVEYHKYENVFDFKEITNFPIDIQDIYKFENKYNVKIYLFKISENKMAKAEDHQWNCYTCD